MKVTIDTDEWYPFHYITEESSRGIEVDVPQATVDKWIKTDNDLHEAQVEMRKYYDTAKKQQLLEKCKQGIPAKGFD